MPKVPVEQSQFNVNTPGLEAPYSAQFRKEGEAIQQTGAELENAGFNTYSMYRTAESQFEANKAATEDKLWASNRITELKTTYADGYIHEDPTDLNSPIVKLPNNQNKTIAHQFQEEADKRYQDNQQSMSSQLSLSLYRQHSLDTFGAETGVLQAEAHIMNVKAFDDYNKRTATSLGAEPSYVPNLVQRPSFDETTGKLDFGKPAVNPATGNPVHDLDATEFYRNLDDMNKWVHDNIGVMHNANEAEGKKKELGGILTDETMRNIYTNALMDKKLGDPSRTDYIMAAYHMVKGDDPQSIMRQQKGLPTFSDTMVPKDRETQLDKLLKLLPTAKEQDWENYRHLFDDHLDNAINGRVKIPDGQPLSPAGMELLKQTILYGQSKEGNQVDAADRVGKLFGYEYVGRLHYPGFESLSKPAQNAMYQKAEDEAKHQAIAFAQKMGIAFPEDIASKVVSTIESTRTGLQNSSDTEKRSDVVKFLNQPLNDFHGQSRLGQVGAANKIDYTNLVGISTPQNMKLYQNGSKQYKTWLSTNGGDLNGGEKRAFLSKDQSSAVGASLQDTTKMNDEMAGKAVSNLTHLWGKDFSANVDQMVRDGSIPYGWKVMALHAHDSPAAQRSLMSALRGYDAQMQKLSSGGFGDTKKSDIDAAVQKYAGPRLEAMARADSDSSSLQANLESLRKVFVATTLMNMPVNENNVEKAAQVATSKLLGEFDKPVVFGAERFYNSGGKKTQDFIPNVLNGRAVSDTDRDNIQYNVNYVQAHPEKVNPVPDLLPNGKPGEFSDKWLSMVKNTLQPSPYRDPVQGYGHYFTYVDQSGYVRKLQVRDAHGNIIPYFLPASKSIDPKMFPRDASWLDKMQQWNPFRSK